jgi:hypothetical protein
LRKRRVPQAPAVPQGPFFVIEEEPAPPSGKARRLAAILVPLGLIAVIAALSALFLAGVVRMGRPSMTAVSTASRISRASRPLDAKTRFTDDDDAVYCCATVRAFGDTRLEARWSQSGTQVAVFKSTFGAMAGPPAAKFTTARGNVAFALQRPRAGWVKGPYTVKVFIAGRQAGSAEFLIGSSQPSGLTGVRYTDPSGGFSILVPEGWLQAEASSLGGAVTGFIAPAGQAYPPRFAVSLTDFTSTDVKYLNDIVSKAGANPTELFSAYSVGDIKGARRVFDWDYQGARLRSVQVVLATADRIYSIDCHGLATEFATNEPVFNAVINSFR